MDDIQALRREFFKENKKLKEEKEALESKIKSLAEELESLKSENTKLKQTNKDIEFQLKKNADDDHTRTQTLLKSLSDLQKENSELNQKKQESLSERTESLQKNESLNQLIQNITNQRENEGIKRKYEELLIETNELKQKSSKYEELKKQLEGDAKTLAGRLSMIQDDNNELKQKNNELQRNVNELNQIKDGFQQRINQLLTENESLKSSVDSVENYLRKKTIEIEQKNNEIKQIKLEYEQKIESLKSELSTQRIQAVKTESKDKNLVDSELIDEGRLKVVTLNKQLTKTEDELSMLSQENRALKAKIRELELEGSSHEDFEKQLSENLEKEALLFVQKLQAADIVFNDPYKPNLKRVPREEKALAFKNYFDQVKFYTQEQIKIEALTQVLSQNDITINHNATLADVNKLLNAKLSQKVTFEEKKANFEPDQKTKKPIIIEFEKPKEEKGKIIVLDQQNTTFNPDDKPKVIKTGDKPKPIILNENNTNNNQGAGAGTKNEKFKIVDIK